MPQSVADGRGESTNWEKYAAALSIPVKHGNRLVALVCLVYLVELDNQRNHMNQINLKRRGRLA